MSSAARHKYIGLRRKVDFIRSAASSRKGIFSYDEKQTLYHAALAANVAAWDSFVKNIIREFYAVTSNPLDAKFNTMHTLLESITTNSLEKFNTPNWENTRNVLIVHTGYDPYPDWNWRAKGMAAIDVKERLNQILKVRHSFAHGFSMPSYPWIQDKTGRVRLTSGTVTDTSAFFDNLVRNTEAGLKRHIVSTFGLTGFW